MFRCVFFISRWARFLYEEKANYCDLRLCDYVWEWVNRWDYPRGLTIPYFFPIKKVESALPSLWKFPTTPSWKIMTKSSNSCWKRSTRGQSSSSPVKKTYGEEHSTFWLHPCRSGALMICHVEVFNLWVVAPEGRLQAQIYHAYRMPATQTHLQQRKHKHCLEGEVGIQITTE